MRVVVQICSSELIAAKNVVVATGMKIVPVDPIMVADIKVVSAMTAIVVLDSLNHHLRLNLNRKRMAEIVARLHVTIDNLVRIEIENRSSVRVPGVTVVRNVLTSRHLDDQCRMHLDRSTRPVKAIGNVASSWMT